MLAAQVVARAQDEFQVKVRIIDLFKNPTIAGLSDIVDACLLACEQEEPHSDAGDFVEREEVEI